MISLFLIIGLNPNICFVPLVPSSPVENYLQVKTNTPQSNTTNAGPKSAFTIDLAFTQDFKKLIYCLNCH